MKSYICSNVTILGLKIVKIWIFMGMVGFFCLGFWCYFFRYTKSGDWPTFGILFVVLKVSSKNVQVVSLYTYFWRFYFFIKRYYGIKHLIFCAKLIRWFAAIHTTAIFYDTYNTVSIIFVYTLPCHEMMKPCYTWRCHN